MKHCLLTMEDLQTDVIYKILEEAKHFGICTYPSKKIANLFFEPSTRTHYSFLSAQLNLHMKIVNFEASSSSLLKGESFYDTVKTFESLDYDALVIRHSQNEYYKELQNIKIPIINAGDGSGNHPSQCLLDLYTIYDEFETFKNINVVIVGDIKHSRVAHSNIEVLKRLGANVCISGPTEWMENTVEYKQLDEAIVWADVVMLLRIQLERHDTQMNVSTEEYFQIYGLTKERASHMKETAIIMHPAPFQRNVEIDSELVESKQSRIFKQMENGVKIRQVIMRRIFEEGF